MVSFGAAELVGIGTGLEYETSSSCHTENHVRGPSPASPVELGDILRDKQHRSESVSGRRECSDHTASLSSRLSGRAKATDIAKPPSQSSSRSSDVEAVRGISSAGDGNAFACIRHPLIRWLEDQQRHEEIAVSSYTESRMHGRADPVCALSRGAEFAFRRSGTRASGSVSSTMAMDDTTTNETEGSEEMGLGERCRGVMQARDVLAYELVPDSSVEERGRRSNAPSPSSISLQSQAEELELPASRKRRFEELDEALGEAGLTATMRRRISGYKMGNGKPRQYRVSRMRKRDDRKA